MIIFNVNIPFNLNIVRSKILTVPSCSIILKVGVVPSLPPPPPPRYQTFLEKCKKKENVFGAGGGGGGGLFINLICYLIQTIFKCEAPFLKVETLIYDTDFVGRHSSFIIAFIFAYIQKKMTKKQVTSYRPISVLPVVSNIIETVIAD